MLLCVLLFAFTAVGCRRQPQLVADDNALILGIWRLPGASELTFTFKEDGTADYSVWIQGVNQVWRLYRWMKIISG